MQILNVTVVDDSVCDTMRISCILAPEVFLCVSKRFVDGKIDEKMDIKAIVFGPDFEEVGTCRR